MHAFYIVHSTHARVPYCLFYWYSTVAIIFISAPVRCVQHLQPQQRYVILLHACSVRSFTSMPLQTVWPIKMANIRFRMSTFKHDVTLSSGLSSAGFLNTLPLKSWINHDVTLSVSSTFSHGVSLSPVPSAIVSPSTPSTKGLRIIIFFKISPT